MINVTKTYLPPLREYNRFLKKIWLSRRVTNSGPLSLELERKLEKYLGVKHLFFVSNGTVALQFAMKALGLNKEIITTPFSFVASTSSIVWENCRPRFVDIDADTLCIDARRIEPAITSETQAILAVHVFGHPCDVTTIDSIAKERQLNVIYDAAHSFGVTFDNSSVLNHGDVSTLSFHATKLFHTGEGGAVVTNNDELAARIPLLRNFGYDHSSTSDAELPEVLGINGKNSELHAAMGLSILPRVKSFIRRRKAISEIYSRILGGGPLRIPVIHPRAGYNYAYYPVIFPTEEVMLKVVKQLERHGIYPRRYFYPSLNTLKYVKSGAFPVSEDISRRILCLPLYSELRRSDARKIGVLIMENV
ncbi:MAG TPA: DegT/DnrJ/EryC1/StrS family aminotransferase [Bacteroidota bacterium]|nr:DegT/DnrJ/EryC1/StrS family aminotransferase [Bacteroidota bacterium]